MKKYAWVLLGCLGVVFAGCRRTASELRIEPAVADNVRVVTAEPAMTADKQEGDIQTAKDKPGAVAVKVQY